MRQFSLNLAAVVKTPNSDSLKPTTVMKAGDCTAGNREISRQGSWLASSINRFVQQPADGRFRRISLFGFT